MNGNIKYINPLAEALTGYTRKEALGRRIDEVFRVICEGNKDAEDPTRKVLREGAFFGLEDDTILISKDDTRIPLDIIGSPVTNKKNEIIGAVIIFYDITERKAIERSFHCYDISYS